MAKWVNKRKRYSVAPYIKRKRTKHALYKAPTSKWTPAPNSIVPSKFETTMRYVSFADLTGGTSGAATSIVFRANGLFDPDVCKFS